MSRCAPSVGDSWCGVTLAQAGLPVLLKDNVKDAGRRPAVRTSSAPARRRRDEMNYALLPRTMAKGSGFAQGTNFVTENQAPTAFVLSWTLMRSPRTLMNCSMSREAGALSVQLPSEVSVTSPGENALSARAPAPCT